MWEKNHNPSLKKRVANEKNIYIYKMQKVKLPFHK